MHEPTTMDPSTQWDSLDTLMRGVGKLSSDEKFFARIHGKSFLNQMHMA